MVAAAEQQRDQHGVRRAARVEGGESVDEQRLVQLDVAEVHGQAGPQAAHAREELTDGGQGARIAAAVADEDQRGRLRAPVAVGADRAGPAGERGADRAHQGRRTVGEGVMGTDPAGARLPGCCASVTGLFRWFTFQGTTV